MGRRLATHVWVESDGGSGWFGPDDELPSWAEDAITNPAAFDDGEDEASDGPPPKSGRGSGLDAWKAYAAAHDVEVPDGVSKDDLITALESAGVPTESQ